MLTEQTIGVGHYMAVSCTGHPAIEAREPEIDPELSWERRGKGELSLSGKLDGFKWSEDALVLKPHHVKRASSRKQAVERLTDDVE